MDIQFAKQHFLPHTVLCACLQLSKCHGISIVRCCGLLTVTKCQTAANQSNRTGWRLMRSARNQSFALASFYIDCMEFDVVQRRLRIRFIVG